MSHDEWRLAGVGLLGMWHGINPAMGWLFAVALGMQDRNGAAVWRAIGPLALGHALAVGVAVLAGLAAGVVVPGRAVQWLVAGALVAMGVYRLARGRHPQYGGMRMSAAELAVWSLLMATAHGAGLMVVPFALQEGAGFALGVTLLHTGSYLLATALVAAVVYRWLGLRQLRRVWVNLDLVWGVALLLTGVATPLL